MKKYRCTRKELYTHECLGKDNLSARQGYYIEADTEEEAFQKMAIRFPHESEFTIHEWESFDIRVVGTYQGVTGNIFSGVIPEAIASY
jgi:hypothetical protein